MASWQEIQQEIAKETSASPFDRVRRKYLKEIGEKTGRNVIAYYSGWLQKPNMPIADIVSINDDDKNGFMAAVHELDREKGLDLMLHTPGGNAGFRPLTTYAEVKDAVQNTDLLDRIQRQNGENGIMPSTGRMSQNNINLILQWNANGLLEN